MIVAYRDGFIRLMGRDEVIALTDKFFAASLVRA
jgi:hypothetical protein